MVGQDPGVHNSLGPLFPVRSGPTGPLMIKGVLMGFFTTGHSIELLR